MDVSEAHRGHCIVARALPDIALLRDRCRAFATLDAMLSPAANDGQLWPGLVDDVPQAYRDFAEDYFEVPVDLGAVRAVLRSS